VRIIIGGRAASTYIAPSIQKEKEEEEESYVDNCTGGAASILKYKKKKVGQSKCYPTPSSGLFQSVATKFIGRAIRGKWRNALPTGHCQ
jgi:hypothetical protein